MKLLLTTLIFIVEFALTTLPYQLHKKVKNADKLEIASICLTSFFKIILVYLFSLLLLKITLDIALYYSFTSIFFGKVTFILKFHAIAITLLVFWIFIRRIVDVNMKLLPAKTDERWRYNLIFSTIFLFFLVQTVAFYVYMGMFFPNMDIDQLFFTIFAPKIGMNSEILRASLFMLLVLPSVITSLNFILNFMKLRIALDFSIKIKTENIFPFFIKNKLIFSSVLLTFFVIVLFARLPIIQFIEKEMMPYSNFYETYYIDPAKVEFKFPEKKKNLIFIYLESLEAEATNAILEGVDLIPELTELAKNNLSFSQNNGIGGPLQIPGTSYSIASCCNTHIGLPLTMSLGAAFEEYAKRFFGGAYGLGNILSNGGGYETSYLIGSLESSYAMNVFLESHGFPLKGLKYWRKIKKVPDDYFVWWGLEDKKLVEYAKEELLHLSKQNKPFAFSVFFEDTHSYKGYVCEECENKYASSIHNVYECTSRRVGKFLEWMKGQDFYENSLIVILGDHLYMGDDLYNDSAKNNLFQNYSRHAYNVFINAGKDYSEFAKNRNYCTFDYFPTIIDCLGIEYNESGLGIGRSLVRKGKTLLEELGEEKLSQEIEKKNALYRKLLVQ